MLKISLFFVLLEVLLPPLFKLKFFILLVLLALEVLKEYIELLKTEKPFCFLSWLKGLLK